MAKEPLDRYKGRLTPAQIATGMNAACENAKRLVEAATLLIEKGHHAMAASLAAIAIEEAGKPAILRSIALAKTDEHAAKLWKDYRTHTRKNPMWILPQLVAKGARKLDDFREIFNDESDHPELLDKVKQIGLYTDCLGKAHWSIPTEVIDKELTQMLVATARILARNGTHTENEVRLWVKHMGPAQGRSKERMEHALSQWYVDMQKEGLIPAGKNEMEEFILKGV